MYSGTTYRPFTGRMIGAHQKIDRLSRRDLNRFLIKPEAFPSIRLILHFEGINGPDAIKRKSPARDEPWHYYSPLDKNDNRVLKIIQKHHGHLADALKSGDMVRAGFEASWLAHAIVDGLTPAHHYPYEKELSKIMDGASLSTRHTLKRKIIMPGTNKFDQLNNNWKVWGPGGLMNTHGTFEWGVSAIMAPIVVRSVAINQKDIEKLKEYGLKELFKRTAKEINSLGVYEQYMDKRWTPMLARTVKEQIVPSIVATVTLAWYEAADLAGNIGVGSD